MYVQRNPETELKPENINTDIRNRNRKIAGFEPLPINIFFYPMGITSKQYVT